MRVPNPTHDVPEKAAARAVYRGPGRPRTQPWRSRDESAPLPPELAEAEELRREQLARTGGRPWTPSSELLAEDEDE